MFLRFKLNIMIRKWANIFTAIAFPMPWKFALECSGIHETINFIDKYGCPVFFNSEFINRFFKFTLASKFY